MPSTSQNMLSHHFVSSEPVVTAGGASTGTLLAPVLTENTLSKMLFPHQKNFSHYWHSTGASSDWKTFVIVI